MKFLTGRRELVGDRFARLHDRTNLAAASVAVVIVASAAIVSMLLRIVPSKKRFR
ncbi:MAG TPA: hypothetical protein VF785_06455 [Gemmatimonadaceae bacterium]